MKTEILRIEAERPEADKIRYAADVLQRGGVVAFPTETVYGLGANALSAEAVQAIFVAKGRPANNPLIVHVADVAAARKLTTAWPATAQKLAEQFWPGSLSLVLPKAAHVPGIVTAGAPTIAVRVPAHPVALALIHAAGMPIAAPSANRSNSVSPTSAEHVRKGLDGRIDLILDAGATSGGLESTVLNLTMNPPTLLRPGLVTQEAIEARIGPLAEPRDHIENPAAALPSPGMMSRHYAPRAPLECVAGDVRERILQLLKAGVRPGWLSLSDECDLPGVICIRMSSEATAYSSQLYAALHALDDAGVEQIVVDLPPDTASWQAVLDRLRRASR